MKNEKTHSSSSSPPPFEYHENGWVNLTKVVQCFYTNNARAMEQFSKTKRKTYMKCFIENNGGEEKDYLISEPGKPVYCCEEFARGVVQFLRTKKNQTRPEAGYRDELALKIQGAICEYPCRCGWIDIFSPSFVIEVKRGTKWKNAVGQVLCYGVDYPSHSKVIALYGKVNKELVRGYCSKFNVDVWFLD